MKIQTNNLHIQDGDECLSNKVPVPVPAVWYLLVWYGTILLVPPYHIQVLYHTTNFLLQFHHSSSITRFFDDDSIIQVLRTGIFHSRIIPIIGQTIQQPRVDLLNLQDFFYHVVTFTTGYRLKIQEALKQKYHTMIDQSRS